MLETADESGMAHELASRSRVTTVLVMVSRLVVGAVWIVAGALKLPDPAGSVRAVRAYQLLPEPLVPTVGHFLPIVEVVIGVCLIVGLFTRVTAIASVLLTVAFIVGISAAWARGLQIDCGCFGGGGFDADATKKYPWDIARDVALVAAALLVARFPRRGPSADRWLFPKDAPPAVVPGENE
jgi:uncharacterized membrane protein YphA (DoxX/SURF4 family)